MQVEIQIDGKWEASYKLSRENIDKVYKLIDILVLDETEDGTEGRAITRAIETIHEENDL